MVHEGGMSETSPNMYCGSHTSGGSIPCPVSVGGNKLIIIINEKVVFLCSAKYYIDILFGMHKKNAPYFHVLENI